MPLKREGREMPKERDAPGPGGRKSHEVGRGSRVNGHNDESHH